MELHGGCLCGGTRYALKAAPRSLGDCHCIDCRRSSGAPYVTWGTVDTADLTLLRGQVRKVPHAGRLRYFAACCGTHLFFRETDPAEWTDVTVASLDDPAPFAPQKAIWTEDHLSWVPLNPALPAHRQSSGTAEPSI